MKCYHGFSCLIRFAPRLLSAWIQWNWNRCQPNSIWPSVVFIWTSEKEFTFSHGFLKAANLQKQYLITREMEPQLIPWISKGISTSATYFSILCTRRHAKVYKSIYSHGEIPQGEEGQLLTAVARFESFIYSNSSIIHTRCKFTGLQN